MYRALGEAGMRRALRAGETSAAKVVALRRALDDAVLHDNATAVVISSRPAEHPDPGGHQRGRGRDRCVANVGVETPTARRHRPPPTTSR
jgi:hypothetical protein